MGVRMQAVGDLLHRYAEAFRFSWKHRKEMEAPPRLPHEAQFLPAALSLQETPVSPAPRVVMWLLIAFALIALLWAIFGKIDVVATAQGRIVPGDRTKTIQPFETANVKRILVTDGQAVKAGDVLLELDSTTTQADRDRILSEMSVASLQVVRGQAMLDVLDGKINAEHVRPQGTSDRLFAESQRLLAGQIAEYSAKLARLDAEISRLDAEMRSNQDVEHKLVQTLPIAARRASDYKKLVDKNFASRHEYMQYEQARIELEADLASQRSKIKANEAALREGHSQRVGLTAETRRATLDSITDGQQKLALLAQDLVKAESRDRLMRLTSPVDGTVQQLAMHTIGGVVTPAQAVMVIVPKDNPLEVEAFVENKDIGFVRPQQVAEVKIETFQYTKYGTIPSTVTTVSHDAVNDEKRGLIYPIRVAMSKSTIMVDGAEVNLSPGMAVSVEVKTGKRRVIEYFLSPLIQHTSESLRER